MNPTDSKRLHGRPRRKPTNAVPTPQPSPLPQEWICLGEIVAPFGLRGDVKMLAQTDFPDRITRHSQLFIGSDHRPFRLRDARPHGGVILLHFIGLDTINDVEPLRNLSVFIPQEEIAPLPSDHYYIHDLIGLQAVHINGTSLGTIADVYTGNAQDLLVVKRAGQPEVLVPLVKALVPTVDIANKIVTIDPPGGLFDDDAIIVDEGRPVDNDQVDAYPQIDSLS